MTLLVLVVEEVAQISMPELIFFWRRMSKELTSDEALVLKGSKREIACFLTKHAAGNKNWLPI